MLSSRQSTQETNTPQQMSDALGYIKQGSQLLKNRGVNNAANVSMAALNVYTEGAKLVEVMSAAKAAATVATTASTAATATTAAAATSTVASTVMAAAPFAAAAFAAFSLVSSLLDDDDEDEAAMAIMQGLSMISNQVYNMHSDMNKLFDISFDFHRQTLNLINDTCKLLHDKIHSSIHEFCLPAIQSLGNQLNLWCKTITDGQDVIALAPYRELKRDIDGVIKGIISGSKERLEEINLKAFSWLKQGGQTSLPMHTGAKLFLETKSELDRNKWINDVALASLNEETLKENYGFLAYYSYYALGVQFCDEAIIQSVFNSPLWYSLAKEYIHFRLKFDAFDPGNSIVNQIGAAAVAQLTYIQSSQTSKLIPTILDRYKESVLQLGKMVNDAFVEANDKINSDMTEKFPEYKDNLVDVRVNPQEMIASFERYGPEKKSISQRYLRMTLGEQYQDGCTTGWHQPPDASYASINSDVQGQKQEFDLPASLITAEALGLLKLNITHMSFYTTFYPHHHRRLWINIQPHSAQEQKLLTLEQYYPSNKYTQQTITLHQDVNALVAKETDNIKQHILQKRKEAVQSVLASPKLEAALQKIDANLRLSIAYAITVGLRPEEIKLVGELWNSNNLVAHLREYLNSGDVDTVLPNLTMLPNYQRAHDTILQKLEKPEEGYFQNPLENELRDALIGLNLVKMKSMTNPSESLKKIYTNYVVNFEIWSSEDYLQKVSSKKKEGPIYKEYQQQLRDAEKLFEQLNKALQEENSDLIKLISDLKKLNQCCRVLHKNLKFLALGSYSFTDDDFSFLATDTEELDKLEKHCQETQEEKGSFTKNSGLFPRRNRVVEILSKPEMRATLEGKPVYFARIKNNGTNAANRQQGSCGYISMNVPRDEVKRVLEQALEQKEETSLEIRKLIGGQIANDFREGCLRLSDDNIKKLSELMEAFSQSQVLSSSSSSLYSSDQAKQAEKNLMVFLCNKELAKDYLKHNILDTWMPMRAAKAYAMATDTSFTVFGINTQPKAGDKGPDDLYPIEMESFKASSASTRAPKNIIFMGNHYEELVEVPAPSAQLTHTN